MKTPLATVLTPQEIAAARYFVSRVLDEVRAPLRQASLFGSKARREARVGSDLDILLIFEDLPPSREPYAGQAEAIAEEVAAETAIPVSAWSVSLVDLQPGARTPMLVDAMEDAYPIWSSGDPLPAISFTADDALRCCMSLMDRVSEGGREFSAAVEARALGKAFTRARDDVVRLCTCLLLLRGVTRPRRAEVIGAVRAARLLGSRIPRPVADVLEWVELSFGSDGKAEVAALPPPLGSDALAATIDELRNHVGGEIERLRQQQFRNFKNRVG